MKLTKVIYRLFIIGGLMLVHSLGVLAQSSTVTIRELWSTPNSTTYGINTYTRPTYTSPSSKSSKSNVSWRNTSMPTEVRGDRNYEVFITKTVNLFYKSNKTLNEYDELRQYAYEWRVLYSSPKDDRLRSFYRFHGNLHRIFGDKKATILEDY